MNELSVFIGWDSREPVATYVAAHSIQRRTQKSVKCEYLKHRELSNRGLFSRPWITFGPEREMHDMIDGKKFSTEFSHTRFLVPSLMNHKGWALFMDSDMIFLSDIGKLFDLCDDKYAVMCVKHNHIPDNNEKKMDGREQLRYFRKNWSSFVLWNCGHPANRVMTPEKVNYMQGRDLHSFSWLEDYLIGDLPYTYNYISGVSPKMPPQSGSRPDVIHYTEGGPWFDACQDVPYAQMWLEEYKDWQNYGERDLKISEVPTTVHEEKEVRRK